MAAAGNIVGAIVGAERMNGGADAGRLPETRAYAFNNVPKADFVPLDNEVNQTNMHTLPGVSATLRNALANSIRTAQTWTFGPDGLPFRSYDGAGFTWLSYKFPVSAVNEYPREGAIPIVQREVVKHQGSVEDFAVGAKFNLEEFNGYKFGEQGLNILDMVIKQLLGYAIETISLKIAATFVSVSDHIRVAMADQGKFADWTIVDFVEHHKRTYGVASRGNGRYMMMLNDNVELRRDLRAVQHTHLAMHPITRTLLSYERKDFFISGPKGVSRFEGGPDMITTYNGMTVNVLRSYRRQGARESEQVLNHDVRTGEFYPTWRPGARQASPLKANDGISIYDEDADAWTFLTMDEIVSNALNLQEQDNDANSVWATTARQLAAPGAPNLASKKVTNKNPTTWYADPVWGAMEDTSPGFNDVAGPTSLRQKITLDMADDGTQAKFYVVRDNIHRVMATDVSYSEVPGETLIGAFKTMTSGDASAHTVWFTQHFTFGTYLLDPERVQLLQNTSFVKYICGKGTDWMTAGDFQAWVQRNNDDRSIKRPSMWSILVSHDGDATAISELRKAVGQPRSKTAFPDHNYWSLVGEYRKHGYNFNVVDKTAKNGGVIPGLDYLHNLLGMQAFARKLTQRLNFGMIEPPNTLLCRGHVRGLMARVQGGGADAFGGGIGVNLATWSSGDRSFDGGDGVGMASVRRGECVSDARVVELSER